MSKRKRAITILELILAISFLSMIVLAISSISYFSHSHTVSTDRRARLQNQISVALEHVRREISKAVGNEIVFGANTVVDASGVGADSALKAYIDSGAAFVAGVDAIYAPGDGQRGSATDRWIAYRLRPASAGVGNRYQIWFCPDCQDMPACSICNPGWGAAQDRIARNISVFQVTKPVNGSGQLNSNSISLQISACWDPSAAESVDNPCLTTDALISMPSVSIN